MKSHIDFSHLTVKRGFICSRWNCALLLNIIKDNSLLFSSSLFYCQGLFCQRSTEDTHTYCQWSSPSYPPLSKVSPDVTWSWEKCKDTQMKRSSMANKTELINLRISFLLFLFCTVWRGNIDFRFNPLITLTKNDEKYICFLLWLK